MQIITNWWGVNHLLFEWHFVFWTHPTFQAQNRKWKFWPQFRIFIPYLMKSATSIKVSYINEIDMSSSIHKMNAINILAIYTPQITSQTSGSPFISIILMNEFSLFGDFCRCWNKPRPPHWTCWSRPSWLLLLESFLFQRSLQINYFSVGKSCGMYNQNFFSCMSSVFMYLNFDIFLKIKVLLG